MFVPPRAAWLLAVALLTLGATSASAQSAKDQALKARVEAVIKAVSDIPTDSVTVSVTSGVVTLAGSLVCDRCGAGATPGGPATLEQSLAAVVRAVPGVERVEIRLRYGQR
jgi:BON domain